MSMPISPYFIVNPTAGARRGIRRWKVFHELLKERKIDARVSFTENSGHAQVLAGEAVRKGFECLVAFGGDGTLNEVLNGALKAQDAGQSVTLGFIGAGSSNDFPKNFEIPDEPFLDRLLSSKGVKVDVGKIECFNRAGTKIERYFLVNSTIGVVPEALHSFNEDTFLRRAMKRFSVDLAIVASGLSAVMTHQQTRYTLVIDGERMESIELTNLAILKGSYFGGGMSYGFRASMDDGLFRIVAIEAMSRVEKIKTMLRFYQGTILHHPRVWKRDHPTLTVHADKEGFVEADGEIVGLLPASYTVIPKAVSVVLERREWYA